ncbi:MAG: GNAT family N-acetyltransferase [Candidatus Dormibacteraceae bacterium]
MKQRYGDAAPYGSQHVPDGVDAPGGVFVVAIDEQGVPIGCGGLRGLDEQICEVKSMFVQASNQGQGTGRALLRFLEELARWMGYQRCRLNTGQNQPEALSLYRSAGYEPIPAYNKNPLAAYWFEKIVAVEGAWSIAQNRED